MGIAWSFSLFEWFGGSLKKGQERHHDVLAKKRHFAHRW